MAPPVFRDPASPGEDRRGDRVYFRGCSGASCRCGDAMKPVVFGLGTSHPGNGARRAEKATPGPTVVGMPTGAIVPPSERAGADARKPPGGAVLGMPSMASSSPEAVAAPVDEEFVVGLKRRAAEFLADFARADQRTVMVTIAVLTALLVYSYYPALQLASVAWANAQYAHGWIVPLFSVGLLFWWRQPAVTPIPVSARVAGLLLLVASFALRLAVARFRIVTIDMYTFVPALVGAFLLAGGWSVLRWAWTPLLFLIFMFPLPDEATRYLLGPLQTIATIVSTFALQTLGLEAYREGNQIILGEMHLGVVDACSGLRMLTIFCALAVGLVMVGRRSWWENGIILASAIPIALVVNSIRITITGLLFQVADSEFAERVFHDWAGMVMMPMAMAMLYFEQYLLSNIFLPESDAPSVLASGGGAAIVGPMGRTASRPSSSPVTLPGLGLAGAAGGKRAEADSGKVPDGPVAGNSPGGG